MQTDRIVPDLGMGESMNNDRAMPRRHLYGLSGLHDRQAARNREMFEEAGVLVVTVAGARGSGKSSILRSTHERLPAGTRMGVLFEEPGPSPGVGLHPGPGMDAGELRKSVSHLDLEDLDILFVERSGGIPAIGWNDLGQNASVLVLSATGDAGPLLARPWVLASVHLVAISKVDLVERSRDHVASLRRSIVGINPDLDVLEISTITREGVESWMDWVELPTSPVPVGPCRALFEGL